MSESQPIDLHLERLPRTIALVRAGGGQSAAHLTAQARRALDAYVAEASVPAGAPVLVLLDQTRLPGREEHLCTADWRRVIEAIKALEVRGAPAIGIAGAAAVALRAAEFCWASADGTREDGADFDRVFVLGQQGFDAELYREALSFAAQMVRDARPTAVNLAVGVDVALGRAWELLAAGEGPEGVADGLVALVQAMERADEQANRAIGAHGAALLAPGSRVLTHCNAGSLATAFYGTALGVVYAAAEQGRIARVYADETRPVGQGARLTAWELARAGVPVTLLCDSMAADVLAQGRVDAVVVGADRIAANGDVANKVGSYGLAVLARYHGVPFYVAAPGSTIDLACPDGAAIPIEERAASEVLPEPIEGVEVWNPAFDVVPAELVSAIVTERGAFAPERIAEALEGAGPAGAAYEKAERS